MTKEQTAEALSASELTLASALAKYVQAVTALRDIELLERLGRKFQDKEVQQKMRELLRET